MKYKTTIGIIILVCIFEVVSGQSDHHAFYRESQQINNTGMYVLGSWAVLNITAGAVGWANGSGSNKYFHQMNLFWNTVNLSIAGFALINNYHTDYMAMGPQELLDRHLKIERLYLINAGLDILYMGAGAYLYYLSRSREKNKDLLKGYGQSIILQGGFLFVFDAVMYLIQHARSTRFMDGLNMDLSMGLNFFQLTIPF
jgi:hypothetical protein